MRDRLIAHTKTLNALRETQVEHGQTLAEHGKVLAEHSRMLTEHSRMLTEHGRMLTEHGKVLGEIKTGVAHITALLTTIIERDQAQD